jgi:arsenate reductase
MQPSEMLRKNDHRYKKLISKIEKLSEDELFGLMIINPDLIQSPIVEKCNNIILARPVVKIKELF